MRAGRPRKSMAPRFPGGKVDRRAISKEVADRMEPRGQIGHDIIEPSPLVTERRIALLGSASALGELECPTTILRSKLDEDQRIAAEMARTAYQRYAAASMHPRVVAGQLQDFIQGSGGSGMPVEVAERATAEYEQLRRAILREVRFRFRFNAGNDVPASAIARQAWREVRRLMQGEMPRNLHALKLGLDAIVEHRKIEQREGIRTNTAPYLERAA